MIGMERKEVLVDVGWSRALRYACASRAAARFSSRGGDAEAGIIHRMFNTLLHFVEELKWLDHGKMGVYSYR